MKKNIKTNRYQFLQREEVWIIKAMINIAKTQTPEKEETYILDTMNRTLFINESDPFIDTFEKFLEITEKYDVENKPDSMTGYIDTRHYTGVGNGEYYRLFKNGPEKLEHNIKLRQNKRELAYEKAALSYEHSEDILEHKVLLRAIRDLKSEIAELKANQTLVIDSSVIQPAEHSFTNIEQFYESHRRKTSDKMLRLRQSTKQRRKLESSWLDS